MQVKSFPANEKYRLVDQLIGAARSVSANIVEGHGRYHYQENSQFCRIARSSLVECFDHLNCSLDEFFITDEPFKIRDLKYDELHKMLNGYISYLKKKIRKQKMMV